MFLQIVLLIVGLGMVLLGAEALVDGSSSLARRWGMSEFVIGLTIVALGTSAPEMVVSFIAAIQGKADVSVGNIVGSNIFNTGLILGISALICPMLITPANKKRDIPVNIIVTLLLIVLGMKHTLFGIGGSDTLQWWDGALFLAITAAYMWYSIRHDKPEVTAAEEEAQTQDSPLWKALFFVLGGLALLVFGGRLFVNAAEEIALMAGLSEKFIAVTILAAGTSLPELATSIVAAAKGKGQLALGNVLGSNTFNILLILGGSAVINPLNMSGMNWIDLGVMLLTSLFLIVSAFTFKRNKLDRIEGGVLFIIWALYMAWLIYSI